MKTIAVIDDDIHIGNLLEEVLSGAGYRVLRAYSGTEAVYLLSESRPDLILLDLMLPGCDGLTILESVCAMDKRPVILVVSRIFGFYVQDSMERLGVSYAMQKPCDVNAVSNRLKELARYPKSQLLPIAQEEEIICGMLRALGFSSKF